MTSSWDTISQSGEVVADEETKQKLAKLEEEGIFTPNSKCSCAAEKNGRTGHSIWCARIRAAVRRGGRE